MVKITSLIVLLAAFLCLSFWMLDMGDHLATQGHHFLKEIFYALALLFRPF